MPVTASEVSFHVRYFRSLGDLQSTEAAGRRPSGWGSCPRAGGWTGLPRSEVTGVSQAAVAVCGVMIIS